MAAADHIFASESPSAHSIHPATAHHAGGQTPGIRGGVSSLPAQLGRLEALPKEHILRKSAHSAQRLGRGQQLPLACWRLAPAHPSTTSQDIMSAMRLLFPEEMASRVMLDMGR